MESQMNRKIRQVDQGARSNGIPSPPQVDLYRMDVDYNLRHTTRGLDHKEWSVPAMLSLCARPCVW